jgi:predicted ferric reductase
MDSDRKQELNIENIQPQVNGGTIFAIFAAVLGGMVIGLILLPEFAPGISQSILSSQPKAFWFFSRGSALIAYGLLWLTMVLGVGVTNKMAARWPGLAKTNELHQYLSILGLAFGLFHGLILLGDQYSNFSLVQILLPFSTSSYRPFAVGLGQMGFYLWILLLASFYMRRKIGVRTWRFIHYFSYMVFLSTLIHGLMAGTDAGMRATQIYYWITGGILLFLSVYRVLNEIHIQTIKKL